MKDIKDRWQKCPVCEGRKEINAVPNYPIYGQIECPVCKGFGIIEIDSGKPPKQDHVTTRDLNEIDKAEEEKKYSGRPNPRDVNPYDSKARKRTKTE